MQANTTEYDIVAHINETVKSMLVYNPTGNFEQLRDQVIHNTYNKMRRETTALGNKIICMKDEFKEERNKAIETYQASASAAENSAARWMELYHEELVFDSTTEQPALDAKGRHISKWKYFEKENAELTAKINALLGDHDTHLLTKDCLRRALIKGRKFKNMYKEAERFLTEDQYLEMENEFTDWDKSKDVESDEDLRDEPRIKLTRYQDPALPPGYSYKASSD